MIRLLRDGVRAPNATFSRAGWGALVVTSVAVLGAMALFPSLRGVPPVAVVLAGTAVQLGATLVLAGSNMRADHREH